jgi:hypothetical protein
MEDNYNPTYGGVSFKEFEAAGQKIVEYLSGLAGTVQIRDMVKDEIRENLMKDVAIAGVVNLSMDGARGRFVEALKALHEDMTRKETSETQAKTETL